jgi:hypothetical protein
MLDNVRKTLEDVGKMLGNHGGQENIKKMLNNAMDDWGHYR